MMKKLRIVIAACSLSIAAQAQLIDDFSTTSLSAYTKSVVLEQDGVNAVSFSAPSGALQISKSSGANAEQVLFLRNDFNLGIGQTLRVDASAPQNVTDYADFGLAISAVVDPADAVWTSGTASTRQDYLNVYLKRSTGAVGYIGFNGTTQAASSSGVFPASFADVTGLFINRIAADSFDVGYSTAGGDTSLFTFTGMNSAIGNAIGFYADVRATTSYGELDNLRIEAVPEPATLSLLTLGGVGALLMRRNKKQS